MVADVTVTHAAASDLSLDRIAVGKGSPQAFLVVHLGWSLGVAMPIRTWSANTEQDEDAIEK